MPPGSEPQPDWPVPPWLLIAGTVLVVVIRILKMLAEASETSAKLLGPLGTRWRAAGDRKSRRQVRAREARDEELADMHRQLDYLVPRVKALTAHTELVDDYLTEDAAWHARLERWAATEALILPPPEHKTFNEFKADRERGVVS